MTTTTTPSTLLGAHHGLRIAWYAVLALATGIGAWSLRYALPHPPSVPALESFSAEHTAFVIHAVTASIALLLGPWQFLGGLRTRRPELHRWIGRSYALAILIAWIASISMAMKAHTGQVAGVGFLMLGIVWLLCTAQGIRMALLRRIAVHREWMLRSYALTAAGITLRIYLGVSAAAHWPINEVYAAIAWLCWVPNLAFIEVFIRTQRAGGMHRRESASYA